MAAQYVCVKCQRAVEPVPGQGIWADCDCPFHRKCLIELADEAYPVGHRIPICPGCQTPLDRWVTAAPHQLDICVHCDKKIHSNDREHNIMNCGHTACRFCMYQYANEQPPGADPVCPGFNGDDECYQLWTHWEKDVGYKFIAAKEYLENEDLLDNYDDDDDDNNAEEGGDGNHGDGNGNGEGNGDGGGNGN